MTGSWRILHVSAWVSALGLPPASKVACWAQKFSRDAVNSLRRQGIYSVSASGWEKGLNDLVTSESSDAEQLTAASDNDNWMERGKTLKQNHAETQWATLSKDGYCRYFSKLLIIPLTILLWPSIRFRNYWSTLGNNMSHQIKLAREALPQIFLLNKVCAQSAIKLLPTYGDPVD